MRSPVGRFRHITLAAAVVVAAVTWVTTTSVQPARAAVSALLVGDSVMNGMAQSYGAPARAQLAARHSYILDTAGCRRLITTSCSIGGAPAPSNAITVVRGRAGQYDRVLVMGVGYNDQATGSAGVGAAIDTMVGEARRQGVGHVIWLTYREAGSASNISRFRANNAVVRAKAAEIPELRVADWAARSAALPASWFSADGVHLGSSAALAMADLIADAIDLVGVAPPPDRCSAAPSAGTPLAAVPPVAPADAAPGGGLHLLGSAVRLVDTRSNPAKVGAGHVLQLSVAATNGVPADAAAALVTVTSVEPCASGFLAAFPCGSPLPTTSVVNAAAGTTVANSAVVRLGSGQVCVYSSQPADVIVDLTGFVAAGGARTRALAPVRLVDTRPGERQLLTVAQRRVEARRGLTVDLRAAAGVAGIDPEAAAVTINLTAVSPGASGFLAALAGACPLAPGTPATSNVNVAAGRDAATAATVQLIDGQLCIYNSVETDIVIDVQAVHGDAGDGVTPVTPARLIDTRGSARLAAGSTVTVGLDPPDGVQALMLNLTAIDPAARGYLAVAPCAAGGPPVVSSLNVEPGVTVANHALVSTGGSRSVCVTTSVATDIVVDVEAWLSAT